MENNLMVFEGNNVEVFELNDKVLFNPKDVARCLELSESARLKCVQRMNNKQVIKLTNSDVTNCLNRKLNNAGENFLTESGVYKMIFASRSEGAERFQDWVTDEVLPSIRKTGSYNMNKAENIINKQQEQIDELKNMIMELAYDVKRTEKCVGIRSKQVFNYSSYIKNRLGIRKADGNYKCIKQRILYENECRRWEELTYSDDIIDRIDELVDRYKEEDQINFFEKLN